MRSLAGSLADDVLDDTFNSSSPTNIIRMVRVLKKSMETSHPLHLLFSFDSKCIFFFILCMCTNKIVI